MEPKVGPKRDPNRIFDAEALGKALEGLLERSWRLLEPKKKKFEPPLGALKALLEAETMVLQPQERALNLI